MTSEPPKKHSYLQKLWVPVVIIAGLVIGESISYLSTSSEEYGPPRATSDTSPTSRQIRSCSFMWC